MTKADLTKTAKELNELFVPDTLIDPKASAQDLKTEVGLAISMYEKGDNVSSTVLKVWEETDWEAILKIADDKEKDEDTGLTEKELVERNLRILKIWVNVEEEEAEEEEADPDDIQEAEEVEEEEESPAPEKKKPSKKPKKKEEKKQPAPQEKEKKPKKKREGKDQTIEKSTVVQGMTKGSKVNFTSSHNHRTVPNKEMVGEVVKVYISARMGKEAIKIKNAKGVFYKTSESVSLKKG